MTERPRLRILLAPLAVALALGAPLATPAQAEDRPLVIARDMDLNSLDPHRGFCDTCQIYFTSAYEPLVTLDRDNKVAPLLAESWEVSDDQLVYTLKLDPAARFSDGSPVEAEDVKWSLERFKNVKGSAAFLTDPIVSVEAPDPATVVITINTPNSEFAQVLAAPMMAIMNSEVAAANGATAGADADQTDQGEAWLLANSAGSGPFVLAAYEPNSELRLKRNESYWRDPAGVSEVVFRQVKDAVAQAQMLQSGAVDIAMQIDPETAQTLRGDDVVVESVPSFNFVYVALAPGAVSNQVPLTPEVREAISLGIDREGVNEFTLGGAGRLMAAPIPLGFPGSEGHEIPPYDPERAKELLASAGHPDGFAINAVYPDMNVYGVDFSLMMQKVQQDLSRIGVAVTLNPVPFANWREQVNGDGIPMTAVFYAPDFFGTSQYVDVFGLIEGSTWANRAGAARDPSVINTGMAAIRDAALAAPTAQEAEAKWAEAAQMMIGNHIILPMTSPDMIMAYRTGIEGVRYSACCNLPLAEITN